MCQFVNIAKALHYPPSLRPNARGAAAGPALTQAGEALRHGAPPRTLAAGALARRFRCAVLAQPGCDVMPPCSALPGANCAGGFQARKRGRAGPREPAALRHGDIAAIRAEDWSRAP